MTVLLPFTFTKVRTTPLFRSECKKTLSIHDPRALRQRRVRPISARPSSSHPNGLDSPETSSSPQASSQQPSFASGQPSGQLQDGQGAAVTPEQQPQQHGPGLCACCRPLGGEPVQVITYMDGVVLEVESPDGTVVYLGDEEEWADDDDSMGAYGGGGGGSGRGNSNARFVPDLRQIGPLVYVPDVIIPPPSPPPAS